MGGAQKKKFRIRRNVERLFCETVKIGIHKLLPDRKVKVKVQLKAASNNVIPAKAGIQKLLKSLDSRLRGSDKLIIIKGSLKLKSDG
jgi:hypothetical protein